MAALVTAAEEGAVEVGFALLTVEDDSEANLISFSIKIESLSHYRWR